MTTLQANATLSQSALTDAGLEVHEAAPMPVLAPAVERLTGRQFHIEPAVRRPTPLLLGLAGPSGSGKTYSALRLATGIAKVAGGDVVVIDTENRRAQHYADHFSFLHIDFAPPYGPMDYLAAIHTAERANPACIIIDSLSHEHDGEGGTLDCVTAELDRLAGTDTGLQQKLAAAAWRKPKAARRALLSGLLRLESHVIVCIRANERTRMAREALATEPIDMGLTPVTAPEFLFELTCSTLLKAGAQGCPTWASQLPGEHAAIKLPRQFEAMFKEKRALDEQQGELMARWAAGQTLSQLSERRRRVARKPARRAKRTVAQ